MSERMFRSCLGLTPLRLQQIYQYDASLLTQGKIMSEHSRRYGRGGEIDDVLLTVQHILTTWDQKAHSGDSKYPLQELKLWLEKAMAGSFRKAKDVQQEGLALLDDATRQLECERYNTQDPERATLCEELSQAQMHLQHYISNNQ
jgi:hypothetical protein